MNICLDYAKEMHSMVNDTARNPRLALRCTRPTWSITASVQGLVIASLWLCGTAAAVTTVTCPPGEYPNPFVGWCPGDCDGNRMVAVNELVTLVGTSLAETPTSTCAAGDRNSDGKVQINEIVSAVTAVLNGCPPGVDMLLRNGRLFTADSEQPAAEAVAICGERISSVGSNDALRGLADAHTAIIDAGGRTIVPGFNDAHKHVTVTPDPAFLGQEDPLLDDTIAAVEGFAQRTPPCDRSIRLGCADWPQ